MPGESRFRDSFTSTEGQRAAKVVLGRIVNINLVNWTVDVVSQFDRHRYFDIQVSSPYLHYANGEGLSMFPDIGAHCAVCIPSDSNAPFVLAFTMPHELTDSATDDAPGGTRSHGAPMENATDASFAGGRPRPKPGDIWLRGRDGNFVVLHRGGVLQIGCTEGAQRIYVPLGNLVTDIAENYAMHNAGGSIVWGLQDGPSLTKFPAQYLHTFRVFANDKFADVRLAIGKVYHPVPEPDGGANLSASGVGQGDNPIIYELTVAPLGFNAESGDVADAGTAKKTVLKFAFDRAGNTFFRCEGQVGVHIKKKLTIKVSEVIELRTEKSMSMTAKDGIDIDGGAYSHVKGAVVRLGPGVTPVARLQDLVSIPVAMHPVTITFATPPTPTPGCTAVGVLTFGTPFMTIPLSGSIVSGQTQVLA